MKVKFTTTLNDDLVKLIKIKAIKENTSVANIIEKLLYQYVNN